jgi:hypothetical protein
MGSPDERERNLGRISLDQKSSSNLRGDLMCIRDRRLQVMLTPEEFAALSNFQFQQRIPSRSAAIRELLRLGLTSKKRLRKKDRKKNDRLRRVRFVV